MGNYKFKLSNILPNAWFYKLRDMGTSRNTTSKKKQQASSREVSSRTNASHHSSTRKSYYFTRELATRNERHYSTQKTNINDPETHSPKQTPRKSSKHKVRRRAMLVRSSHSNKLANSSVSTGCGYRKKSDDQLLDVSTPSSPENETEFRSDNALPTESFDKMLTLSSSCVGRVGNPSDKDIIINIDKNSLSNKLDNVVNSDMLSGHELPPIITKPVKCKDVKEASADGYFPVGAFSAKNNVTERVKNTHVKRCSRNSPGVRLRVNSPRIAGRKIQSQSESHTRKSISSSSSSSRISLTSSYAVVKSSFDPRRDFKESMMEMILENNIKSSKDLEDLLACYLSLNLGEYHGLIIRVFKEIWCDLTDIN